MVSIITSPLTSEEEGQPELEIGDLNLKKQFFQNLPGNGSPGDESPPPRKVKEKVVEFFNIKKMTETSLESYAAIPHTIDIPAEETSSEKTISHSSTTHSKDKEAIEIDNILVPTPPRDK